MPKVRAHMLFGGCTLGKNIICAVLLLFMPEEEAFWLLANICEELLPQYFTRGTYGPMTLLARVFGA
jgi:hypothetical protein